MRLSHDPPEISACFGDPNLVSRAGLVPVMGLAERAGLAPLVRDYVHITAKAGCLRRRRTAAWSPGWPRAPTRSTT